MDLDELMEGESSVVSGTRRARLASNRLLNDSRKTLASFGAYVSNIAQSIDLHPEIPEGFWGEEFADLGSGAEYLDWVNEKVSHMNDHYWYQRSEPSEDRARSLNEILGIVASGIFVPSAPPGDTRVRFPI